MCLNKKVLACVFLLCSFGTYAQKQKVNVISGDSIKKPYDLYILQVEGSDSFSNTDTLILTPKNNTRKSILIDSAFYYVNYLKTELDGTHEFVLTITKFEIINSLFKKKSFIDLDSKKYPFLKLAEIEFEENSFVIKIEKDETFIARYYISFNELDTIILRKRFDEINCMYAKK